MPKAKTIKACGFALLAGCIAGAVQAQPVLGQVIDQTKQFKQRQLMPAEANKPVQEAADAPVHPPTLWSISGINDQLVAEIWQGDAVYRLPLHKGAKLPSGWQVQAFDKQSVTLKLGKESRKLSAAARGSTGWEFPQTPRTPPTASSGAAGNNPVARTAASNLPPAAMPPAPPPMSSSSPSPASSGAPTGGPVSR